MKKMKAVLMSVIVLLNLILHTGCWNYREIDKLAIVSGAAIDKGINEKYSITVEVVEISRGQESEAKSKTVTMEGNSIFEAVRHLISVLGKRLYWSHSKVVIISEEVAKQGVVQVLDWFNRDAETRSDIHIFVSREKTAKEILKSAGLVEKIIGFELNDVLDIQKSLPNAPHVEIWKFTNNMQSKGIAAVATAVDLKKVDGEESPHVEGTAIFKGDRLVGFLDGNESMNVLFVQGEIKGGTLVYDNIGNKTITLEIFKNKTKLMPSIKDGKIEMNVSIETTAAIDEVETTEDVIGEEGRKKLEAAAEKMLKAQIEAVIKKVQLEYNADIFGVGNKIREYDLKAWNTLEQNWNDKFRTVKFNVNTKIHIKNSAMLSKPLEVGY